MSDPSQTHGEDAHGPAFDGEAQLVGVVEVLDGQAGDTKTPARLSALQKTVGQQQAERLAYAAGGRLPSRAPGGCPTASCRRVAPR